MTSSRHPSQAAALLIAVSLVLSATGSSQDASPEAAAPPNRWLLLCCGLPGDEEHRERLTEACRNIISAAPTVLQTPPEQIRFLAGDEEMREALADESDSVGICSKESVAASLRELSESVPGDAGCWVVMLGHSHLYGSSSHFNVLGPDFDQEEFAGWAKPINCREQVFWLTMPISGFWTKPLATESRVIITATEADLEFTGTEMPYALADLLVGEQEHQALEDVDGDGALSLLDLYLAVGLEVHQRFTTLERLQTEHAQLEDNGDGRGSEVQQPYLPIDDEAAEDEAAEDEAAESEESTEDTEPEDSNEATEPRQEVPKPIGNPLLDGYRSRHIPVRRPSK